jgi:hypothetical protein
MSGFRLILDEGGLVCNRDRYIDRIDRKRDQRPGISVMKKGDRHTA